MRDHVEGVFMHDDTCMRMSMDLQGLEFSWQLISH